MENSIAYLIVRFLCIGLRVRPTAVMSCLPVSVSGFRVGFSLAHTTFQLEVFIMYTNWMEI
jgi:hypothetical protein